MCTKRCDQNGKGTGYGVKASPYIDIAPSADRQYLTHPVIQTERGKPEPFHAWTW